MDLDLVLECAIQMVFRLEGIVSVEASLALARIEPARCHTLWPLVMHSEEPCMVPPRNIDIGEDFYTKVTSQRE